MTPPGKQPLPLDTIGKTKHTERCDEKLARPVNFYQCFVISAANFSAHRSKCNVLGAGQWPHQKGKQPRSQGLGWRACGMGDPPTPTRIQQGSEKLSHDAD
jgi:hypothetical protein